MSKKRRFPRHPTTSPQQLKAQEAARHQRKINVVLESLDGQRESVRVSESEWAKAGREYDPLGHTRIEAEGEDGMPVALTVGRGNAGSIYGEKRS